MTYTLKRNVRMQRLGDEAVLLNLDEGVYYALNTTGVEMVEALLGGDEVSQVVCSISQRFDGPSSDRIASDLRGLIAELEARGLIGLCSG